MNAADVRRLVLAIDPFDDLETQHRSDAERWLASTTDVFRRVPPSTPAKHLVAYFPVIDPTDGSVLLVAHRKAARWLPTGGHVEPGEDPADTVRREIGEELGIEAIFAGGIDTPAFVTVTPTVGRVETRHVDVSLWYPLLASRDTVLSPDQVEFSGIRWWTPAAVADAGRETTEPELPRFLAKLSGRRA